MGLLCRLLLAALTVSIVLSMPTSALGASVEFRATPDGEQLIELPIGLPVFVVVTGASEEPVPDSYRIAMVTVMAGAGTGPTSGLLLPLEPQDSLLVGGPIVIGTAASHGFQLRKLPAAQGDTIVVQSPLVRDSVLWAEVCSPIFALSTPTCLPGHTFSVDLRLPADIALTASRIGLRIPKDWQVELDEQRATGSGLLFCQIRRSVGEMTEISCRVHVPTSTLDGIYATGLILDNGEEHVEFGATINVQCALDPHTVVTHWNVSENALDLAVAGAMTSERLRWANSLAGTILPHTDRKLDPYVVDQWVDEWQANPGSVVWPPPVNFTCVGLLDADALISSLPSEPPVSATEASDAEKEPDSAADTERVDGGAESTPVPAAPPVGDSQPAGDQQPQDEASLDRSDVLFDWTFDKEGVQNRVDGVVTQASGVSVVDIDGMHAASFASASSCLAGTTHVPVSITGALTVLAWIRSEADAGRELLVSLSDPESESPRSVGFSLYSNWIENRPAVVLDDGMRRVGFVADRDESEDENDTEENESPRQPTEWRSLAVVIDNGSIQFFIDGEPAGIRQTTFDLQLEAVVAWIGQCIPAAAPGDVTEAAFSGLLNGLLILNRALSGEELSGLLAEQQTGG